MKQTTLYQGSTSESADHVRPRFNYPQPACAIRKMHVNIIHPHGTNSVEGCLRTITFEPSVATCCVPFWNMVLHMAIMSDENVVRRTTWIYTIAQQHQAARMKITPIGSASCNMYICRTRNMLNQRHSAAPRLS